jgi:hypothetical protein
LLWCFACTRIERQPGAALGTDESGTPIDYVGVRLRCEGATFYALGDSLWWVTSADNTGPAQLPAKQVCDFTMFGAPYADAVRRRLLDRGAVQEAWHLGSRWRWRFWRQVSATASQGLPRYSNWAEAWPAGAGPGAFGSYAATAVFACDDEGLWRVQAMVWDDNGDSLVVPPGHAAVGALDGSAVFRVVCWSR